MTVDRVTADAAPVDAVPTDAVPTDAVPTDYSTVTLLARLRGLSTSRSSATAAW